MVFTLIALSDLLDIQRNPKKINEKGFLIGFDLDPYALKKQKKNFSM